MSRPILKGVAAAREVIPGMRDSLLLHAGPPITWEAASGPMRGAITGALIFEGLATDEASADIALSRVTELLVRFQAHPLFAQLSAAERHHDVPYSLMIEGRTQSGLIDLLSRASSAEAWTIVEFMTDRLPENVDLGRHALGTGYDQRAATYRQVIAARTGASPQMLLVFLNVGQTVQVLNLANE